MNDNIMLAEEVQSFYARNSGQLSPLQRRVLADAVTIIRSLRAEDPLRFVFGAMPERGEH